MKTLQTMACMILITSFILELGLCLQVSAAFDDPPQSPPFLVRVDPKNNGEPAIGYNEFDNYYVDFKWNVSFPGDSSANFLNFYVQEITKPYRPARARIKKEKDVAGGISDFRLSNLSSGTIYYVDMTAYHTHVDGNTTYSSPESVPSNKVKVLTDISINAFSIGTNQIKIEWDDVWNTGRRIDYKLYVSEDSKFSNTPPIYIGQPQIGEGKSVTVNEANGTLEYTHTVRDSGRVYYIKIAPDVPEAELKRSLESRTVTVSSFILVRSSKVSTTDSGIIWKLEWSPVVTGLSDSSIKVSYQIYKGTVGSSALPQYMAAVDGTNFFVTHPPSEVKTYYIIRGSVKRNGEDVYPGIKIESDQVIVGEQEVSSQPTTPEIVDKFEKVLGDIIISYEKELSPNSATILWRLPQKADGTADNDVAYDIWLVNDPNILDNPPESFKLASSVKMGSNNLVLNGSKPVGYKYTVSNLTANSTYYFKIVAKKTYIEYVNEILQNVTYYSDSAIKVIITPTLGPIDQPMVPARPPFKVKKGTDGKDIVSHSTLVIQMKNMWYEKYNFDKKKWEYIRTEKTSENDTPDFIPTESVVDDVYYRKVGYDGGVTIDVGCIKFTEGMSYSDIETSLTNKITGVSVTANDPLENAKFNPDGKKHNVDITLTNLEPNTVYILWLRAARLSANVISGPSDPIIITTRPNVKPPIEKPTVPAFNYNLASDTFVDLGWEIRDGYTYYLRYSTEDNINQQEGSATVTPQQLLDSTYYRVNDLKADTLYYFWIQADAGENSKSEWSDSYPVKTLPDIPPYTPRGFGVKNSKDAVTKSSITFEWIQTEGTQYIIEIAADISYKNSKEHDAGTTSEFKVDGLKSNHRYFARIYAYNPTKKLRSEPTQSITVRTKRSSDDYDADQDIDSEITGDFIVKDPVIINDTWNIRITGVNADRFIEVVQKDRAIDYRVDLSLPPGKAGKISVSVSDKVFVALTELRENLILSTQKNDINIRPGVFTGSMGRLLGGNQNDTRYEILIAYPQEQLNKPGNIQFKTEVMDLNVVASNANNSIPVKEFNEPLKVSFPYSGSNWYREGLTSGFLRQVSSSDWSRLKTSGNYDLDNKKGTVTVEVPKAGSIGVGEAVSGGFADLYYHKYENAVNHVASVHPLKSVEGNLFEPDLFATLGSTVRFMMDALDFQYGSDYMLQASKAGFINASEVENGNMNCSVKKATLMTARLYELKMGKSLGTEENKLKFAVESGIVLVDDNGKQVSMNQAIRRAEVLALIEKLMLYTGEIE